MERSGKYDLSFLFFLKIEIPEMATVGIPRNSSKCGL